jgi:hypothetical protein
MHTESQYGNFFIPPYDSYLNSGQGGYNANLHVEQTLPENGRFVGGETIKPQASAEGDHGYITSPTDSPDVAHMEENGIPYHHRIRLVPLSSFTSTNLEGTTNTGDTIASHSAFDPANYPMSLTTPSLHHIYGLSATRAYQAGTYSSTVKIGLGVPWKTEQGTSMLWNKFFSEHYQISESDWETNHDYYHYLFGTYLSSFVLDFLAKFVEKEGGDPATGSDTAAGGFYHYAINSSDRNDKMSFVQDVEGDFLNAKALVFANPTSTDPIYKAIGDLRTSQPATKTLQEWFLGNSSTTAEDLWYNKNPEQLEGAWKLFMTASNIYQRRNVTFLWVMHEVIKMMGTLGALGQAQTQRLLALSTAQQSAVNNISAINFLLPGTKVTNTNLNSYMSAYIEQYRSRQQMAGQYSSQVSGTISSTASSTQQESTLMASVLKQIEGLIRGIFNR